MRKCATLILIASISFLYLISCDGGGGKSEEYDVYDVITNIDDLFNIGTAADCPESADLKLSMLIKGKDIKGTEQLFGFGHIGEPVEILGTREDDGITLQEFKVVVYGESAEFLGSLTYESLQYTFNQFQGLFNDNADNESGSRIEGNASGKVSKILFDAIYCSAEFTGEFTGISRSPEGCVSSLEYPTLECPAEGFVNQCEQYQGYFCPGWCEPPEPCVDFVVIPSECEIIDCLTLTCPVVGNIHLQEQGGFMFGSGEHTLHCG